MNNCMALQTSGAISLNDIATEFGGSTPHSINEYYGVASGVPSSGTISFDDFYGTSNSVSIQYLIVAGGGAHGHPTGNGGGGGAGGLLSGTQSVPGGASGNITVGGATAPTTTDFRYNGGNSSWSATGMTTKTAIGGGYGGGWNVYVGNGYESGANGGSGGGTRTSSTSQNPGTGTSGQGHDGLRGIQHGRQGSSGSGGGAGGAPTQAQYRYIHPGPGVTNNITGSNVTYAVGGMGHSSHDPNLTTYAGFNYGGGGGQASGVGSYGPFGGIVILRMSSSITFTTSGLTVTTSTVGSDKVYQITGGSGTWSI